MANKNAIKEKQLNVENELKNNAKLSKEELFDLLENYVKTLKY